MKKYQQGDVLFVEVPEGKWDFKEDNNVQVMVPISKNNDGEQYIGSYKNKRQSQSLKDSDKKVTVAHGEATGHSHTFKVTDQAPNVAITAFGGINTRVGRVPEYIKITGDLAVIKHEEHNALTIPAGHYKVGIVREWDHISGIARNVVD